MERLLNGVSEHLLHQRTWRVLFDCIRHMDVERALLQKGVHLASICALLRISCDLKGRINLPGDFHMLAVLEKAVLKGLTCGIRFRTTHSENQQLVGTMRKLVSKW